MLASDIRLGKGHANARFHIHCVNVRGQILHYDSNAVGRRGRGDQLNGVLWMGYGMGNQQYGRQSLEGSRPVDENRLTSVGHSRSEEYPVFLEQEVDSVGYMLKQRLDRRFG